MVKYKEEKMRTYCLSVTSVYLIYYALLSRINISNLVDKSKVKGTGRGEIV